MTIITALATATVLISQQTEVYVLRHGETTWNVQNKMQGQNNESQLTKNGREQVAELVERLRPCLNDKQVEIWSSDLIPAHETAKIIAKILGISEEKIRLEPSLREANFGHFEGTDATYYKIHPDFLHFKEDEFHNAMDPVKGESYQQVAKRVQEAIFHIVEQSLEKVVLIITHGGAMRSLQMMGLPPEGDSSQYTIIQNPKHDEIYIFDTTSRSLYKADF
jgi:broad specificity phosphatase PhoE